MRGIDCRAVKLRQVYQPSARAVAETFARGRACMEIEYLIVHCGLIAREDDLSMAQDQC